MYKKDITVCGKHFPGTYRALGDALLPLAHSDTFLQGGAFLQHQIPTTVRVPGPNTSSEMREGGEKR